jgi:8-oxo-dGTP pyrophosphatase MutT (NUDIX family)
MTQSYNRCYGFPKGEKEVDESLEECAKREFYEETGMNIMGMDLSKFKCVNIFIENVEYVYYIIHVPSSFVVNSLPYDDVEITSFGWISLDRIHYLFLSKAVKKLLKYKKIIN